MYRTSRLQQDPNKAGQGCARSGHSQEAHRLQQTTTRASSSIQRQRPDAYKKENVRNLDKEFWGRIAATRRKIQFGRRACRCALSRPFSIQRADVRKRMELARVWLGRFNDGIHCDGGNTTHDVTIYSAAQHGKECHTSLRRLEASQLELMPTKTTTTRLSLRQPGIPVVRGRGCERSSQGQPPEQHQGCAIGSCEILRIQRTLCEPTATRARGTRPTRPGSQRLCCIRVATSWSLSCVSDGRAKRGTSGGRGTLRSGAWISGMKTINGRIRCKNLVLPADILALVPAASLATPRPAKYPSYRVGSCSLFGAPFFLAPQGFFRDDRHEGPGRRDEAGKRSRIQPLFKLAEGGDTPDTVRFVPARRSR